MFKTKRIGWIALTAISVLLVFSLVSCTTDATDTPAVEPGEPDVVEPGEPDVVEPEDTAVPEPAEETSITILIAEDPPSFNGVATYTGYERLAQEMVMLSLADVDPYGEIYPELAVELPTEENGGVVVDLDAWTMDVTWKLRDDIYWEDGEQVTADDVVFTWNALADEETGSWVAGMDYIDSVEKIDDLTLVFHYNSIHPGYLLIQSMDSGAAIFPEHYCDAEQGYLYWDCNQVPLSNGPYLLEEWDHGDHLTFVRNPTYFEEGKPYIDKVFFLIVPEASVRMTMMEEEAGDIDFWVTMTTAESSIPIEHINVSSAPVNRWLNQLWMNQAARGQIDPETGFPTTPHPVLSDVRVRQAMRMAIDTEAIVEGVWPGFAKALWTNFFRPPYNVCDIPKPVVDPAAASALLEEAGWTDTDGDGVRECHGCTTGAPEGYEMSLEFGIPGDYDAEAQQLISEYLEAVGFDIQISILDAGLLWETFEAGGIEQNADFDIDMWPDGYGGTDPTDYLWGFYHTDSMQPDWGWNVNRWSNEDFDALLEEAYTIDEEYRTEIFCELAQILDDELPSIPLFDGPDVVIYNNRISGVMATTNALVDWNIADWKLVD